MTPCSCGRPSYRPDPVTGRRFAERCSGCHRTTGRCSCSPNRPRTASGRRFLENLRPQTPGQFEADLDAILAIEDEVLADAARRVEGLTDPLDDRSGEWPLTYLDRAAVLATLRELQEEPR